MKDETVSPEPTWTDEQKMQIGQLAGQILHNPVWQIVHQNIEQKHYLAWRALPEQHTKEAAALRARVIALDEIYKDILNMWERAVELVQKKQAENDPATQERQHLDTQGFGLDFGK